MQPDHLLSTIVGAFIGTLVGIVFAAIAVTDNRAGATYKAITATMAFICSLLSGILGCPLGFEITWKITGDVAAAGLGAIIGALFLSATGGLGITGESLQSRFTRKAHHKDAQ